MAELFALLVDRIQTPIGELAIVADERRAACAPSIGPITTTVLHRSLAPALRRGRLRARRRARNPAGLTARPCAPISTATWRRSTDLPVATGGTRVPEVACGRRLRTIPCGATISYAELARRIGRPAAVRAVGLANGANPIGVVVPCHRVIGTNGSLTGYGGGHRTQALAARARARRRHDCQAETATIFHRSSRGRPLLLPNAWDAGSARLMESLGAKAVATTSAGVAWSQGYPDGDVLPVPLLVATVAAIARDPRAATARRGRRLFRRSRHGRGDGRPDRRGRRGRHQHRGRRRTPDLLCLKIERAKRAGQHFGIDLFVNARTDVYLRGLAPEGKRVDETLVARQALSAMPAPAASSCPACAMPARSGGRRRRRPAAERHGLARPAAGDGAGAARRPPPERGIGNLAGAVGQGRIIGRRIS